MGIRFQKQKHYSRIWKPLIFGGTLAALVLAVCGAVYWHGNEAAEAEKPAETAQSEPEYDRIESAAVINQKYMAHTFINKPPASPAAGDTRKVFRIIEVIPHDACSVFPYMIEWGSAEEYNQNLPIGYEGLIALTGELKWMVSGSTTNLPALYTSKSKKESHDFLNGYDVYFGTSTTVGAWYRVTDSVVSTTPVSGYFEYVGAGKGMFYIAPSYVAETDSANGIHYKIQVIPRKGGEAPKGELYIEDPAYYWASDDPKDMNSKPYYNSKPVLSQSDGNYDLSFEKNASGSYRADTYKIKEQVTGREYSDYLLCVEAADSWPAGFKYGEERNYIVKNASLSSDGTGLYVRIEDDGNTDHYSDTDADTGEGLAPGYFRLWMVSDGICPRYHVEFEKTDQTRGYYFANAPLDWNTADGFYFEYAEDEKGIYNVPFIYAGEPSGSDTFVRYAENLIQVTDNDGRYALTSTSGDSSGQPVYGDSLNDLRYPKDYAKVITKIDFNNVVCNGTDSGTAANNSGRGVTLGGSDAAPSGEKGGWVFHPISDASEMDITLLSKIHKDYTGKNSNLDIYNTVGTRIYVRNQTLRYRHYCRNGFVNNELFKLLCYSNNPEDDKKSYTETVNGVGYDFSKSGEENLNNKYAQELIAKFDKSNRIEVMQVSPAALTPEQVRSADLIYFSRSIGLEGLTSTVWTAISNNRQQYGQEALEEWKNFSGTDAGATYNTSSLGDISQATLFTIYDECISERNTALIMDNSFRSGKFDLKIEKNITKLYYLMNYFYEARNFKYFMPEMYPNVANSNYTRIYGNTGTSATGYATLDAYLKSSQYNIEFKSTGAQTNVSQWSSGWESSDMLYFRVYMDTSSTNVSNAEYPYYTSYNQNWNTVLEDETKIQLGESHINKLAGAIKNGNIWQILHNRTVTSYDLIVLPTNADKVVSTDGSIKWVVYGNEMDPASFDVKYKVLVDGAVSVDVVLSSITCTLDDNTPLSPGADAPPQMNTEYTTKARAGFATDAFTHKRTVTITATDTNGMTGTEEVEVIFREAFDLN